MRSVLLHIQEDECLEARLQVALDLARAFGGHVTCAQPIGLEFVVAGDVSGLMAAQMLPEIQKQADALKERIGQKLALEDVAWDWVQENVTPREQLLRRSSLSDIIVLGSSEPLRSKGPSVLVGDIVLGARTPTLVVPADARDFDCAGAAVVAWDGSSEASRALRSAVPLLAKARSVTLVTVVGEGEKDIDLPPTEGAEFLSRHDIACELADLPLRGDSVAEVLARELVFRDASYIVMGAYGRPRFLETLWGGVTRELLSKPPLPILVCH